MPMTAVVTGFTEQLICDFVPFFTSLRKHWKLPVVVIAIDFSDSKLKWLQQFDVMVVSVNSLDEHWRDGLGDDWPKWRRPSIIKKAIDAGVAIGLWIDVDAVIVKSLLPIFETIDEHFLVVEDHFDPNGCANRPLLYELNDIEVPRDRRVVNSGVIGFKVDRDQFIIDRWEVHLQRTAIDEKFKSLVTLYDQGLLLLTLHELGLMDNAIRDPGFNFPGNRVLLSGDWYERVVELHPSATIVHYAGSPKLSALSSRHHLQTLATNDTVFNGCHRQRWVFGGAPGLSFGVVSSLEQMAYSVFYVDKWWNPERVGFRYDLSNLYRHDWNVMLIAGGDHAHHDLLRTWPESKYVAVVNNPRDELAWVLSNVKLPFKLMCQLPVSLQLHQSSLVWEMPWVDVSSVDELVDKILWLQVKACRRARFVDGLVVSGDVGSVSQLVCNRFDRKVFRNRGLSGVNIVDGSMNYADKIINSDVVSRWHKLSLDAGISCELL